MLRNNPVVLHACLRRMWPKYNKFLPEYAFRALKATKYPIIIIYLYIPCCACMAQDRIHTKDGRVIECKVSDSSNWAGNVFFFPADDPETSHFIPVTQVDYLEIGDARVVRTPNDKLKPAERRFYIQRMGSFYFVRGGLGVNVYTASIQTDAGKSREGLAAPVVSLALGLDFRVSRNLYLEVAARYIGDFASWNFGYDSEPLLANEGFFGGFSV